MSDCPVIYHEDLSRLHPGASPARLVHVYEPLDELVTDEDLIAYCWGFQRVSFFAWWDYTHRHKRAETGHQWQAGQVIDGPLGRCELLSAKVVFRQGQWCCRWLARRMDG